MLTYTERSITNVLLSGTHFKENKYKLDWKVAPTRSLIADKDFRISPFLINDDDGSFSIAPSESGDPNRLWRNLKSIM